LCQLGIPIVWITTAERGPRQAAALDSMAALVEAPTSRNQFINTEQQEGRANLALKELGLLSLLTRLLAPVEPLPEPVRLPCRAARARVTLDHVEGC
jgi:hypothetical protein